VSTGIGDTDNITIRAHKIIQQADIVFAMPFIQKAFSTLLEGKKVFDAGHAFFTDTPFNSAKEHDEENVRQMIRHALTEGQSVAVLDFGDPTVYSPQSGYLKEFADLSPEVIPGISSFNAANAALAQEITGRYNHPVLLTEAIENVNQVCKYAATGATIVFFTMKMNLSETVNELKKHFSDDTPAAIVCQAGISESQVVLRTTLENIVDLANERQLPWEHLLYVGEALGEQ
jgi:precorrin-4 methylase